MIRLKVLLMAVLTVSAAPALAQSEGSRSGPYVGLSGGLALPSDSRNRGEFTSDVAATPDFSGIPSGTPLSWRTRFDNGFHIGGQFGYRFENGIRPEVEIAYSQYDVRSHRDLAVGGTLIDGVDSAVLTRGAASPTNPTVGAVLSSDPGKIKNFGVFANLFYDFNGLGRIKPYIGGGAGIQRVDIEYRPSGVPVADQRRTRFAYQLMAGLTYQISPSVDVFGQYSYRATSSRARVELDLLPAELGVQSRQSLISTGLRFHF